MEEENSKDEGDHYNNNDYFPPCHNKFPPFILLSVNSISFFVFI